MASVYYLVEKLGMKKSRSTNQQVAVALKRSEPGTQSTN